MNEDIYGIPFSIEATPFVSTEIDRIDSNLVGIVALVILNIFDHQNYYEWVYLAYGNIVQELKKAKDNPCVFKYVPSHFTYIENPRNGLKYLERLKKELTPHCL